MFGLSLVFLLVGIVLAPCQPLPSTRGRLAEGLAGGLIVCGLTLLGVGLPLFR